MKEELDEILTEASVSSYSELAKLGLNALRTSILIAIVGAAGYGIISAIFRASEFISGLHSGIRSALDRTIPRLDDSDKTVISFYGAILSLLLTTILLLGIYYFRSLIYANTFLTQEQNILFSALTFMFTIQLFRYTVGLLRSYKQVKLFNYTKKFALPLVTITALYLISQLQSLTVSQTLYILSAISVILSTISIYILYQNTTFLSTKPALNKAVITDYSSHAGYTTATSIFTVFQFSASSILLFTLTEIQAGVFGVALIIATLSRIPLTSINTIFPQVATELYQHNEIEKINKLFTSTSKIAIFFTLPIAAVSTIYHKNLVQLFSPKYVQYSEILPILVIGHVLAVMAGTVGLLILMTDNEKQNLPLQIVTTIIALACIIPLTLKYNVYGLALGTTISLTLNNTVELLFLYHKEKLLSVSSDHIKMFILTSLMVGILYHINQSTTLIFSVVLTSISLIFIQYLNYKKHFTKTEKKAIKKQTKPITTYLKI